MEDCQTLQSERIFFGLWRVKWSIWLNVLNVWYQPNTTPIMKKLDGSEDARL